MRLLHNPCLPWLTSATLLFSDVLMLGLASATTIWVRWLLPGSLPLELYAGLWPGLVVFAAIYGLVGLYRVGLTPVEELRLLSYTSSALFLVFGATTFLFKGGELYSRSVFLVVWLLSLLLVPLGRALVRQSFAA
ncbi:MAG: undecaprenyl-phosphate galactose phosphotransferase WbaP, partial [Meiothermus sp.]